MSVWIQFSHNDLDGIACIVLGKLMGIANSHPCSYSENSKFYFEKVFRKYYDKDVFKKVDGVLLTDLNVNQQCVENMLKWTSDNTSIRIIDHHENCVNISHPRLSVYKDDSMCAAQLLYNRLAGKLEGVEKYGDFIRATNGFDTWQHSLSPFALDMQRVFYHWIFMDPEDKTSFPNKLYAFAHAVHDDPPNDTYKPAWYNFHLSEYHNICGPLLNAVWKEARVIDGLYVFPFERGNTTPAFEISILAEKSGIENFVLVFVDKNSTYTISLRTRNSALDLSQLATRYGGGGHQLAASFRIAKEPALLGKTIAEIAHYYTNGG